MTDSHISRKLARAIGVLAPCVVLCSYNRLYVLEVKLTRLFDLLLIGFQSTEEKRDEISSLAKSTVSLNTNDVVGRLKMDLDTLLNGLQNGRTTGGQNGGSHVEVNHQNPTITSFQSSGETHNVIRLGNRQRMDGDVRHIPFLPPLFGPLTHRSIHDGAATKSTSFRPFHLNDIDSYLFEQAKVLSNARPHVSFVVPGNVEKTCSKTLSHTNRNPNTATPLFDGAVANATPIGYGYDGTGGGIGTALHLACAIDSPLALAVLLVMGANASCRHTAFRRLMIHEAACCDSPKCLSLLMEICGEYCNQLQELQIPIGGLNYRPNWSNERMHAQMFKRGETFCDKAGNVATSLQSQSEFVKVLYLCQEFTQKVKVEKLDDYSAALGLLRAVSLSDMNQYFIASTCQIDSNNMMNDCDGHGNTALHWAAFKNSIACAKILLGYKANPNAVASTSGWTPLHDAAYSDSCETLSLLITAGANVNAKANSGATPLCFAAQEDASSATRILLEAGADPTLRCCEDAPKSPPRRRPSSETAFIHSHQQLNRFSGYTPLHYCAHYNAQHSARILLEYHSKVLLPRNISLLEISDLNDKLPIHIAVARGSSIVLRELLHYGARIATGGMSKNPDRNDDESTSSMTSIHTEDDDVVMHDIQQQQQQQQETTLSPSPNITMVTPVSSPVLRSMIPTQPIDSPKPWNCISQRSIDECKMLIQEVEMNWSPERHSIFHPRDRAAVLELLRVGKHLEQEGTGLFLELWPLVLSFCGRGWFEPSQNDKSLHKTIP
jgi:FOG: Ankyrin repeat